MKKRTMIGVVLTIVVWFLLFYTMLPAINIHNQEFWQFAVLLVVVAVVLNSYTMIQKMVETSRGLTLGEQIKKWKKVLLVVAAFVVVYGGGTLLSSPILRASAYKDLLTVTPSSFAEDIEEVDFNQIPIMDKDTAALLAERKMGSMIDMVSQYEVGSFYSQINYQGKPVRVTPLEYSSAIKWLTNRSTGIPAYIKIDMTTQDVELVKLEEGIRISPTEHFGRNLSRYLRFRYPTAMFRNISFEIDDDGVPYWICSVEEKTIGLFGGSDIKGAVLLNAVTGEHTYYDIADVPQWVDGVYDAALLIGQYDYFGLLSGGYLNSIFSQKGCLQTTEGYNYIALNDDVWVYTGITSVTGDESIVGFVLMNQRTKETNYYQVSGAKELSAMRSAEGQVQNLGYQATFPLLLNVGGQPTYFLALKDDAGLVKKYAMVNVERYQLVAIGDTVSQCETNYKVLMSDSGLSLTEEAEQNQFSGTISGIYDVVIDGNTCYFVTLKEEELLFEVQAKENLTIITANVGDQVELSGYAAGAEGVITVTAVKLTGHQAATDAALEERAKQEASQAEAQSMALPVEPSVADTAAEE